MPSNPFGLDTKPFSEEDPSKIVARFAHLRPSTEVRQIMQYNNMHYWIIAHIVAHITNVTYTDYVKVNILDPVGLSASTYNYTKAKETGQASESFTRADQNMTRCAEVWAEQDKLDRSCYGHPFPTPWFTSGDGLFMAGPGGLVSSANDLVSCQRLF
jgi:CubicO group peptidase (beta-lactamase class C family)